MAEKLRAAMGEVIDAAAVIRPSGAGDMGVRHRTGRIARFAARSGNMAGIN